MTNRTWKMQPAEKRRLVSLENETAAYIKAAKYSLANNNIKAAKAAAVQANCAYGTWLSLLNQYIGWAENGVPTTGYAK